MLLKSFLYHSKPKSKQLTDCCEYRTYWVWQDDTVTRQKVSKKDNVDWLTIKKSPSQQKFCLAAKLLKKFSKDTDWHQKRYSTIKMKF